jgi:hypothetical protein
MWVDQQEMTALGTDTHTAGRYKGDREKVREDKQEQKQKQNAKR